ncbi:prolyl oligopeptidase family serine peptidase [candidate division KSB1 bacterium]|nr:prolyl oligopeptidase family serine peptidase [candidate division KSB1 bacterium]
MAIKFILWTVVSLAVSILIGCATTSKFSAGRQTECALKKEIKKVVNIEYLLYLPDDYETTGEKFPLMLFLHGAGERGDQLEKVKLQGPPKLIDEGKKFPCIVLSPQCPANQWWSVEVLDVLLQEACKTYRVDKDRIYVTGLSMGGFGTWALASAFPQRFAAIAPICGGGNPLLAPRLKALPIWVFHGAKDQVVPLKQSQDMVDALEKAGGQVKFTIYPDAGHDSWTETYANPEFYDWLLSHIRKE